MWQDEGVERVRFLPAAWLPRPLFDQIVPALEQVCLAFPAHRESDGSPTRRAIEAIESVRRELRRHAGSPEEPCLLTKQVVFDLSHLLGDASELLSSAGLHAAAFATAAVEDRLLERLIEPQPMAPA